MYDESPDVRLAPKKTGSETGLRVQQRLQIWNALSPACILSHVQSVGQTQPRQISNASILQTQVCWPQIYPNLGRLAQPQPHKGTSYGTYHLVDSACVAQHDREHKVLFLYGSSSRHTFRMSHPPAVQRLQLGQCQDCVGPVQRSNWRIGICTCLELAHVHQC